MTLEHFGHLFASSKKMEPGEKEWLFTPVVFDGRIRRTLEYQKDPQDDQKCGDEEYLIKFGTGPAKELFRVGGTRVKKVVLMIIYTSTY